MFSPSLSRDSNRECGKEATETLYALSLSTILTTEVVGMIRCN